MTLRPYQERFINNIAAKLVTTKRVVAQLATGGGKTVCFAAICDRFCKRNSTDILILVHREELLHQASRAIALPTQPVVAGMRTIPQARVYVAMVETAYKRLHQFTNIGLVIVDECHIGNFTKVIEHFSSQYIIGFTATPLAARKSNPLRNYFDDIICGIDIPELIEQGFLCPELTYSAAQIVDRAKLKMKAGDFDAQQMAAAYKNPKYIDTTVNAYKQHSLGRKTIIFNCNVEHSQAVNAAFCAAGFNSRHLDADSPDRAEILQWFANTPDAILNNIGIATTGFDQPDIALVDQVEKRYAAVLVFLGHRYHEAQVPEYEPVLEMADLALELALFQIAADEDHAAGALLAVLPRALVIAVEDHVHALKHEALGVVLERQNALGAQDVRPVLGDEVLDTGAVAVQHEQAGALLFGAAEDADEDRRVPEIAGDFNIVDREEADGKENAQRQNEILLEDRQYVKKLPQYLRPVNI